MVIFKSKQNKFEGDLKINYVVKDYKVLNNPKTTNPKFNSKIQKQLKTMQHKDLSSFKIKAVVSNFYLKSY